MKKILLPLSLSLLIVFGLALIAAPKNAPAPSAGTKTAEESRESGLDKFADEVVKSDSTSATPSGDDFPSASGSTEDGQDASSSTGSATSTEASDTHSGTLICTDEYAPVCGSDKNTYPNACAAKRMNVESTPGACAKDSPPEEWSEPGNPGSGIPSEQPETVTLTGSSATPAVTVNGLPYDNAWLGYGFVLPKSTYFSGFGSRDGATHSVGVGRNASPESFELSEVKIRFYKGKVLPQLQNAENGFYEDAEAGIAYLSISGSTLTVEGDRSVSWKIIDSVISSAYVR